MHYKSIPEFDKDLKKLLKRFRTLQEDIEVAKKGAIELYHIKEINNLSTFRVPGFHAPGTQIFKLKKFACRALKGKGVKSGIRIIYAYHEQRQKIVFIEMYYKADQERENHPRIQGYLKNCK